MPEENPATIGALFDRMRQSVEGRAWADMYEGKLDGLAALLQSQMAKAVTHGEPFTLPPMIGFELLNLIQGDVESTSVRLTVSRHPDLAKGAHTLPGKLALDDASFQVAEALVRHGAFSKGHHEAAVAAVMQETGLSKSTVKRHWSAYRDSLRAIENLDLSLDDEA